jgi:hypothetical protein
VDEYAHPSQTKLAVLRADAESLLGIAEPAQPAPDRTPPAPKE